MVKHVFDFVLFLVGLISMGVAFFTLFLPCGTSLSGSAIDTQEKIRRILVIFICGVLGIFFILYALSPQAYTYYL